MLCSADIVLDLARLALKIEFLEGAEAFSKLVRIKLETGKLGNFSQVFTNIKESLCLMGSVWSQCDFLQLGQTCLTGLVCWKSERVRFQLNI